MTEFKINFDFNDSDQRKNLSYLQDHNYTLMAFKGASGAGQIDTGVPVWFSRSFDNLFGDVNITYKPMYKAFAYNSENVAAQTVISMQTLSQEVGLGTQLVFNQDGSFSAGKGSAPADSISVINNTESGTANITIGLAALIDGEYLPFCAFISTPQGTLNMTPHENITLFAAQTDLVSGSVSAVAAAPGASFSFSKEHVSYDLKVSDSTYAITNLPGSTIVSPVSCGDSLMDLLNSK